MHEIRTVGVVGAGQMGGGIAQVFALTGHDVLLCDIDEVKCREAIDRFRRSIDRMVAKGKIEAGAGARAVAAVRPIMNLADLRCADFVVEAVTEDVELKRTIFSKLDAITRKDVILASNTSSIPIASLARATSRPEKVVGVHFMNPPQVIEGVEVIRAEWTSDETVVQMESILQTIGKRVLKAHDTPGFTVNRLLFPMLNEAMHLLEEGKLDRAEIDESMKTCCHLPMGPLALADMIGLDTVRNILEIMQREYGERYRPAAVLLKMVAEGRLGKKTRAGFYQYE